MNKTADDEDSEVNFSFNETTTKSVIFDHSNVNICLRFSVHWLRFSSFFFLREMTTLGQHTKEIRREKYEFVTNTYIFIL